MTSTFVLFTLGSLAPSIMRDVFISPWLLIRLCSLICVILNSMILAHGLRWHQLSQDLIGRVVQARVQFKFYDEHTPHIVSYSLSAPKLAQIACLVSRKRTCLRSCTLISFLTFNCHPSWPPALTKVPKY